MPEFRQNLVNNEWVIIATERAKRPEDFLKDQPAKPPLPEFSATCPFCPGHEAQTPAALHTLPQAGSWRVRVVPNKFAALKPDAPFQTEANGRFLKATGYGIAEVIIENPRHNLSLGTMDEAAVRDVVGVYKLRYLEAARQDRISFVNLFRNHGVRAGTSLAHPHSQLIAMPIVPPHVRNPIERGVRYFDTYSRCIACDMLAEEKRKAERVILESDAFLAYAPYASRTPFEVRVMPKRHQASFGEIEDRDLPDFAAVLRNVLARIHAGLGDPDYNFIIRSAPVGDERSKSFHWYLLVIPRLTTPAGFEIGTGIYINIMYPERCAEFLRNVVPPQ
jgi:UDPglucose--hexose-1-phosphate uridylyltransferase